MALDNIMDLVIVNKCVKFNKISLNNKLLLQVMDNVKILYKNGKNVDAGGTIIACIFFEKQMS